MELKGSSNAAASRARHSFCGKFFGFVRAVVLAPWWRCVEVRALASPVDVNEVLQHIYDDNTRSFPRRSLLALAVFILAQRRNLVRASSQGYR